MLFKISRWFIVTEYRLATYAPKLLNWTRKIKQIFKDLQNVLLFFSLAVKTIKSETFEKNLTNVKEAEWINTPSL